MTHSSDPVRPLDGGPLRVALFGFGTVGSSVARILTERPELTDRLTRGRRPAPGLRGSWGGSVIEVTRDGRGGITVYLIESGRVRRLRFTRVR
jgi:hypothetical protein